ncbi:MAG TPA: PEP-utilizing enzyme [Gaiellaceae bacterium]|nr:PEP-utilizing enzyme [Gaiellaceae bacterium]
MSTAATFDQVTFDPPGPGSWILDNVHVPRPWSRFQSEIHPPNLAAGFRESARRYGLLLDTLDWRLVNGFAYFAVPPAPEAEVPVRFQAAQEAFERKLWREDMERWEREAKPASIRAHLALQAVDPSALGRDELLEHLDRCREHQQRMIYQHHWFNAAALVPVGDFIAHVAEWTGRPLGEFLALTRGSAPESAGSFPQLDRLTATIRESPRAQALLAADAEPADVLERLRREPGEVGAAAVAYLDTVGYRLLDSLDTGDPYALEVPKVLVEGIRLAVDAGAPAASDASEEEVARIRALVPASMQEAFDELLAEARLTSRLRDERGLYSEVWAGGITRRVILTAGARLAAEGRLHEPAHLVEAGYEEMRSIIRGVDGPSADELAERARYRVTYRASDAPPFLGAAPAPPPPLDGLPPAAARAMRAIGSAIDALFASSESESEATVVRGIGASPGVYTGTARLVGGPSEFDRLQRGDVLVTATTTESFNIVLPLLGAIVTDSGGLLSHAAIVSREYGIPGVVGCRDATTLIADGTRVRVDGTAGEVFVQAS